MASLSGVFSVLGKQHFFMKLFSRWWSTQKRFPFLILKSTTTEVQGLSVEA
jgi:hypothetical protein